MSKFLSFICLVAAMHGLAYAYSNYCGGKLCDDGITHVACSDGKFSSSCPIDATSYTLNKTMIATILKAHNSLRNHIAGGGDPNHSPACRMATMQWDEELSHVASFNVLQCAMKHDKCRNTDAYKHSGQNLAWNSYKTKTPNHEYLFLKAINYYWYSTEVVLSDMKYVTMYPSDSSNLPDIKHFLAMMREPNTRVGCASASYTVPKDGKPQQRYLMACNYATTNMKRQAIYTSCEKPSAKCLTGSNRDFPNLCSTSEMY